MRVWFYFFLLLNEHLYRNKLHLLYMKFLKPIMNNFRKEIIKWNVYYNFDILWFHLFFIWNWKHDQYSVIHDLIEQLLLNNLNFRRQNPFVFYFDYIPKSDKYLCVLWHFLNVDFNFLKQ